MKQRSVAVHQKAAFAPSDTNAATIGSIIDFEKIGARSLWAIRTGSWQGDQPIGSTWGYTRAMSLSGPDKVVAVLCDTVSKNGNLLLNISPRADGTIPQEQQTILLAVGGWLRVNGEAIYGEAIYGEAIYGTRAWTRFGEVVRTASQDKTCAFQSRATRFRPSS